MHQNIWIMNHYASNMYRDKAGRHFWFARKLREMGYHPVVFCANTYHNCYEIVNTQRKKYTISQDNDISYVFVKTKPSRGNGIDRVLNMTLFFLNLFPVSKQIKRKLGFPDIIIASSVHPLTLVAGICIAKKNKIPCICEIRDLWPEAIFAFGKVKENSLLGRILILGEHWIYRNSDALIFTKEGDTDYLREKGWTTEQGGDIDLKKCHYINNGVNLMEYDFSISKNQLDDQDLQKDIFNVVYTGMLRPVNNVGNLLDCAKLLKQDKEIQFLIYGDGSERDSLQKRVKEENLTNVKIKGFAERKYIPYILSRSNVNILNYSQKKYNWSRGNSSNKLFEYMASGKPIISTVKMGYDIIEKYQCGISLEKDTPENLAKAIMSIKNMPTEMYREFCYSARVGAINFDFAVLANKLRQVIESV